jgi:mono/diheme cytochrome c family protein
MKYFILTILLGVLIVSFSSFSKVVEIKRSVQQQKSNPMIRGKAVYTQYCMPCHQVDGSGVPNLNPPLINTPYVLGSKATLVQILVKGLNKGVEIDGDYYGNPMPAQVLSDQQVSDVLSFVRNSFGNKATSVSVAEVKALKAKIK